MNLASFLLILIGFTVSFLLGYIATKPLLGPKNGPLVALAFAPCVGAGFSSFIFLFSGGSALIVEVAILLLCALRYLLKPRQDEDTFEFVGGGNKLLGIFLIGALAMATYGQLLKAQRLPHGDWDGWAIWNTHARFLYRDSQAWSKHIPDTVHGDYPLLTPSLTARLWRYAGHEIPEAGALLGIMFTLSGVSIIVSTISLLRDTQLALVMGLVLVGTPNYVGLGASQYADVPFALFVLSTIALLALNFERESDRQGPFILAGFMAGCAGWTKNEGLLFILAVCAVLLLPVLSGSTIRRFTWFSVGLVLPLSVIVFFKVYIAPQNELIAHQQFQGTIERITDINRHVVILKTLGSSAWSFGIWIIQPMIPLAALIVLRGFDWPRVQEYRSLAAVLILMILLSGYYIAYLTTPLELQYHLDSSVSRLLVHLWPSLLLITGLLTRPKLSREHA